MKSRICNGCRLEHGLHAVDFTRVDANHVDSTLAAYFMHVIEREIALEAVRAERIADALENDVGDGRYDTVNVDYLALLTLLGHAQRRHAVWKWQKNRPALEQWFAEA